MHLLRSVAGVQVIDFAQGLLGAFSPKPARLLALNLPELPCAIWAHHVSADLPRRSAYA